MAHNHEFNNELGNLLSSENDADSRKIRRIVITGCFINAILMCLKLGTGYFGHSDALVADGYHSLNDFAADLIMLLFIGISFKQADSKFSYGYGKFETLSTLIISVFLLVVSVHISIEAIESIKGYMGGKILPQPDIWTVVVVIVSMFSKEFLFRYYRKGSINTGVKALLTNAWHHRSDALASIATLIGVTFSHFLGEKWRILDPCASIFLVFFIITAAFKMLRPAFFELMDHSCDKEVTQSALSIIEATPGVKGVKCLNSRKNGRFLIFDIEIGLDKKMSVEDASVVITSIRSNLLQKFGKNIMLSVSTCPV